jgi:hypothetical protein
MTDYTMPHPLKLRAHTPEELWALSACLQDSIFPITQVKFCKKTATFKMLVNRFRWELETHMHEGKPLHARVHALVVFQKVTHVDHQRIQVDDPVKLLNLLIIDGKTPGYIHLVLSGGGVIRLHVEGILCYFGDLHEHWPSRNLPVHDTSAA